MHLSSDHTDRVLLGLLVLQASLGLVVLLVLKVQRVLWVQRVRR